MHREAVLFSFFFNSKDDSPTRYATVGWAKSMSASGSNERTPKRVVAWAQTKTAVRMVARGVFGSRYHRCPFNGGKVIIENPHPSDPTTGVTGIIKPSVLRCWSNTPRISGDEHLIL